MGKGPKAHWRCRRCGEKGHLKKDCPLPPKAKGETKTFQPKVIDFAGKQITTASTGVPKSLRSQETLERVKVKKIRKQYLQETGRELAEDEPSLKELILSGRSALQIAQRVAERTKPKSDSSSSTGAAGSTG